MPPGNKLIKKTIKKIQSRPSNKQVNKKKTGKNLSGVLGKPKPVIGANPVQFKNKPILNLNLRKD